MCDVTVSVSRDTENLVADKSSVDNSLVVDIDAAKLIRSLEREQGLMAV